MQSYNSGIRIFIIEKTVRINNGKNTKQRTQYLFYQIQQSFKPGTITPEETNKLGYELAMRFTKENHAFLVTTHEDKKHIHSHIYFNSTNLDCTKSLKTFGVLLVQSED